jgi:hypothetical protein
MTKTLSYGLQTWMRGRSSICKALSKPKLEQIFSWLTSKTYCRYPMRRIGDHQGLRSHLPRVWSKLSSASEGPRLQASLRPPQKCKSREYLVIRQLDQHLRCSDPKSNRLLTRSCISWTWSRTPLDSLSRE